jgi:hypothetical protein
MLGHPGLSDGLLHGSLNHRLVQMMPALFSALSMQVELRCRKHPLPRQCSSGIWVLPSQSIGNLHPSGAASEVLVVLHLHVMQLDTHLLLETHRQHGAAISSSLATTNKDLVAVKV